MAAWKSKDQGKSWQRTTVLTKENKYNHSYVRRPINAHESFYAFWCDGDALKRSPSRLYFANKAGSTWMLPEKMTGESAAPDPPADRLGLPADDLPGVRLAEACGWLWNTYPSARAPVADPSDGRQAHRQLYRNFS